MPELCLVMVMMVKVITERKQFWISLGGGTGGVVGKP